MRLDIYLCSTGQCRSRTLASKMIRDGEVTVDGVTVTKASFEVPDGASVCLDPASEQLRYVSRGGLKLEHAMVKFGLDVTGRACIDVGASSGGFTDCLLQHGAALVHAVDSGHSQLVRSLAEHPSVKQYDNYNARYLTASDFNPLPDVAVMDVSFISQTYILPSLAQMLPLGSDVVTLVKPQFELTRAAVGKGGIVRSEADRSLAIERVLQCAEQHGLCSCGILDSPILGGDGNKEYLIYFKKRAPL